MLLRDGDVFYSVVKHRTEEFPDTASAMIYFDDLSFQCETRGEKVVITEAKTWLHESVSYEYNFLFFKYAKAKYNKTVQVITYFIVKKIKGQNDDERT